jgi:hypothetical protein
MSDAGIQLGYLVGFADGLRVGAMGAAYSISGDSATTLARGEKIKAPYIGPSTFGEIRDGITAICKRPENSLIPISEALKAFTMQVKGKPQSEIDRSLNIARQVAIEFRDSDKANK